MKKNLLLFLSLCIPLLLGAQDWKPLQEGNFYNYGLMGEDELAYTLRIDSVKNVSGGLIVHYLNRIVKECDNCSIEGSFKTGQYQFLNEEMVDQGDGVFLFGGSNNQFFRIYSLASTSQVWNFDPINGITASILMKTEMQVLGEIDSVKTIGLSNGQQILLSKNHGILQFPDLYGGTDEMYSLIGISNLDLGFVTPDFHQIYDWSPGMVLMFEETASFLQTSDVTRRKYTVLDVETTSDSIVVQVEEVGHTIHWDYAPLDTIVFSDMNKRLVFYRDQLPGVDAQINEMVINPSDWIDDLHYAAIDVFENPNGRVSKLLGEKGAMMPLYAPDQDSPELLVPGQPFVDQFHLEYQRGLGITSSNIYIFESGEALELIGYMVDGVQEGIILTDEELLFTTSTREFALPTKDIEVFPNPLQDQAQVRWDQALPQAGVLQVFDGLGQLIEEVKLRPGAISHDLITSQWSSGTYWVKITGASWQGVQSVIKK